MIRTIVKSKTNIHQLFLYIILFLLVFGSEKPNISGFDDYARYIEIKRFWNDVLPNQIIENKYSMALPILSSPLYLLGKIIGKSKKELEYENSLIAWVAQFNHIVVFVFLIWLHKWLMYMCNISYHQSYILIMFTLFFSFLLPHSSTFYSETLWSCSSFFAIAKGVELRLKILNYKKIYFTFLFQ